MVLNTFAGLWTGSLTFAILLVCAGCRVLPPVEPRPELAALGLELRLHVEVFGIVPSDQIPATILFARVGAGQEPTAAGSVLPATWSRKDRFYLLNAAPGFRTCPIAAATGASAQNSNIPGTAQARVEYTFLPAKLVQALCRENLPPGHFTFLGRVRLGRASDRSVVDPVQKHFMEIVQPGSTARLGETFGPPVWPGSARDFTVDDTRAAADAFLTNAREDFKKTQWANWLAEQAITPTAP